MKVLVWPEYPARAAAIPSHNAVEGRTHRSPRKGRSDSPAPPVRLVKFKREGARQEEALPAPLGRLIPWLPVQKMEKG